MNFDPRRFISIRTIGLLGVLCPIIAYTGIIIAIFLNLDWFSWTDSALSDLGHYENLGIRAFVFNGGLFISGVLALIFCLAFYYQEKEQFKDDKIGNFLIVIGVIALFIAVLALIGIGIFSEDFNPIHRFVSEVFFTCIPFAMWFFGGAFYRKAELKVMGLLALLVGTIAGITWISYFIFHFVSGVAIPEAVSSIAVSIWIVIRGVQYYQSS
ncbi:MAG: DUF998 domain-containing protein [Candidatus Heimdallarchaeota archaeon]|nr:MAG: DUF998 domain-containing protein [Candidatus Heimdallarchaeota archaeon]